MADTLPTPITNQEHFLNAIAGFEDVTNMPAITNEEKFLKYIALNGGGNTSPFYPAGNIAFASLPDPSADILGAMYNITDAFTTDSRFNEGAGIKYPAGTNVAVVNTGTEQSPVYKFDTYTGAYVVDDAFSTTSENPVQNKVVKAALDAKADTSAVNSALAEKETKVIELTQAQYDALETKEPDVFYCITDAEAESVIDDTTASGTTTYSSNKINATFSISTSTSGTSFSLTDAANAPLAGLVIEGRTTKTGDAITNVGDGGTLTLTSTNGTATKTAVLTTGLPLCSLTGIKDAANFTAGVVHKKCQKIVMDGNENWVEWGNPGAYLFDMQDHFAPIAPSDAPPNMICDKIPVVKLDSIYTGIGITNGIAITVRAVCVRIANIATVAGLKTYLASNPVTIVYELAEPYDEPMTADEVAAYHDLCTFENTTNVTCTDSPQMTVNYLVDTENGASIGQVSENFAGFIQSLAFVWNTPEMHRNIFRGKYLGDHVTDAQIAAIRDGSFDDLYIGDYWVMGGVNWRIADMDYWLGCGDTAFNSHHLVIVPDTCLYNAKMNDENITTGGYVGSKMYTENLNQAKTTINSLFVDMVLSHREYLVNAVSNGKASGGAWLDSTVELMNESMVYGHREFTPANDGATAPYNYTIDKSQLALFQIAPKFITNRVTWWLRDVVSAAYFASVGDDGYAGYTFAADSRGVRTIFAIG